MKNNHSGNSIYFSIINELIIPFDEIVNKCWWRRNANALLEIEWNLIPPIQNIISLTKIRLLY